MTSRVTPDVSAGRIMATDGGPHPASLWAQIVVDDLCSLGPNLDPKQHTAALRMKADMMDVLEPVFEKIAARERDELHADFTRMVAGIDHTPHADEVLGEILKASKGTRWEQMINESMNVMAIKQLLSVHIATLLSDERSWHVDRNPGHDAAVEYTKLYRTPSDYVTTDEDRELARKLNIANSPGGI